MKYEQYKFNKRYHKLQTKKTKQLKKKKKLVNVLKVQTAHSAINKQSIAAYPMLTITYRKVRTKKAEVIEKLVEKYHVKIPFNTKRGRPRKDLNEEEKKWLETFLSRSDVRYYNPG